MTPPHLWSLEAYRETQKPRFVCCFLSPLNSITKLHQHQLPSEVLPTGMSSPNFVTAFSWREYSYLLSSTANTGSTRCFFVEPTLWLSWLLAKTALKYGHGVRYFSRQFLTLRDFVEVHLSCKCEPLVFPTEGSDFAERFGFLISIPKHNPGRNLERLGPRFRF